MRITSAEQKIGPQNDTALSLHALPEHGGGSRWPPRNSQSRWPRKEILIRTISESKNLASNTIRGRGGVLENGHVLWYRFLLRIFMRFDHKPSVEYKYLRLDFETSKQQRQQTLHCASKATTAATEIANPRPKISLKARPRFKRNLKLEMIWTPTSRSKANPIMKPKRKPNAKTTNRTKPRLKPRLKSKWKRRYKL